jgi:exodeoxyribonuclease VII large subunit
MAERLAAARMRFAQTAALSVQRRRETLDGLERLRRTLGYKETLGRGYAVIRAGEEVLTSRARAAGHAAMEIEFVDGRLGVTPTGATPKAVSKKAPPAKGPDEKTPGGSQGSLF